MLASITVDAAGYDYPYIVYLNGTTYDGQSIDAVFISQYPIHAYSTTRNDRLPPFYVGAQNNLIKLCYNVGLSQWQSEEVVSAYISNAYLPGNTNPITKIYTTEEFIGNSVNVITNVEWNSYEKIIAKSYSNDLTQLPQGLTEDAIRDIVNEQLNTQTASGNTAQTVINNTTNQYNLYLAGNIDSATMQQNVTNNLDTLSSLTPSTLLDAMQINNGLTYNQSIQDQLLNTASGNIQSMINGYTNTITNAVNNYTSGAVNQADTVTIIRQTITNLNNLITNGTATTTADIAAVNTAINAANSSMDSVTGYKDLDTDVSDKVQQSDEAEIEYLEELTSEATSTITDIAPSQNFTASQTGDAQEVLDLIWENEFVKRLLPMCAGFMVVCVVLGIRYKV